MRHLIKTMYSEAVQERVAIQDTADGSAKHRKLFCSTCLGAGLHLMRIQATDGCFDSDHSSVLPLTMGHVPWSRSLLDALLDATPVDLTMHNGRSSA